MNTSYVDNLLFQKEKFPDIYESYLLAEEENILECKISGKEKIYFYLFVDKSINILTFVEEIFNSCIYFDLPISACLIVFGYENRVVSFENDIIKVEVNHPYLDMNRPIIISNSIIPCLLEKSIEFYTYETKHLKQIDELTVKNYCLYDYKTHNLTCRNEVLDCIKSFYPCYSFEVFDSRKAKRTYLKDSIHVEEVSLSVIRTINESLELNENEILLRCVNSVMDVFQIRALESLLRHLEFGDFNLNYILVEKYLSYEVLCRKELRKHLQNGVILSVKKLKKRQNSYTSLYNAISQDKHILELDDYIETHIEKFNELLEEI